MRHTKASKRKLSDARRGSANPFYGKKHSSETRAKLAKILREHGGNGRLSIGALTVRIPAGVSLGYLAGVIDGEGSVRFRRGRPFVAVYNTSVPMMDWLREHVGGTVNGHDKRGRATCFVWSVQAARDVYAVCSAVQPILNAKSGDALKALHHLREKYGDAING